MHNENYKIILGSLSLKAFVTAPKEYRVIGIVRLGLEFGFLGVGPDDLYYRINGSVIEPLDSMQVLRALRVAHSIGASNPYRTGAGATAPQVVVRKRRCIAPGALLKAA